MKLSFKKSLLWLLGLVLLAAILPLGIMAAATPGVSYRTHVQNDGWQDFVADGAMSGTAGRSLRLEGIEIKLAAPDYDLGITYQTHIQNIGWEADTDRGWQENGAMSGTEGLSYRLEAIQIDLTGADADLFDVYYQVHAQNMGWLGWAKNGASAGTAGYSYRLEGIHIVIVPKGGNPPVGIVDQSAPFVERKAVPGNLLVQTTIGDFKDNAMGLDRIAIIENPDDGAIQLQAGQQAGVYTSNIFNASPFTKAVLSWNTDTPAGTLVQVEARVCENALDANGQSTENWSDWLSFGQWGTTINRASGIGDTDSPLAKMEVDTLVLKNGKTANKIQYRVILHSGRAGVTPTLGLVAVALRNAHPGQEITKVFTDHPDLANLPVLNVPQFSQMIREPSIADSICSPTSVAMMLNYYGTAVQPETVAWGAYDYGADEFGNWPFNTAYAGSLGYQAYVDYSTIEGLKREIAGGHPVAVAVAYKNSAGVNASLPVIDGAPIRSTYGHLIVVCGFIQENGTEYIIINDPTAASNAGVRVRYRLDQFAAAWAESGNIAYIIH